MIRYGLDNIEELKRIEEEERNATGSSEVPFDPIIVFEQFSSEVPESQWDSLLFFVPPDATSEEVPYSQGISSPLIPIYFLNLSTLPT